MIFEYYCFSIMNLRNRLKSLTMLLYYCLNYINQIKCFIIEVNMSQGVEQVALTRPKTYFDLINKVGSKGAYQRNSFIIFFLNWYIGGIIIMGTSFLFLNQKFNCKQNGLPQDNCQEYVCANIPRQKYASLLKPKEVDSLATQFGPFFCDDNIQLGVLKMMTYLGTFFGYTVLLTLVDNMGRRKSIIILWGLTTIGVIILAASLNIYMAAVGLFIAGAGCQCCIRVTMAITAQTTDYYLRQKYSVAFEIAFGSAGVSIGLFYWLIRNWRIVQIAFAALPSVILFILICYYIQETPKFLLRRPKQQALKALNRIGMINNKQLNMVSDEDIDFVLQAQGQTIESEKAMTPVDLCRYKSLRVTTVIFNLLFFFISFMYFGPIVIVDKLGFNDFLSQIILSASELIAYPIALIFVERTGRRFIGQIMFAISAVCTGVLIFVVPPEQCNFCTQGIVEIIFAFGSRFCISYYFAILFIYITQAYPMRIRGIGFGIASASGAIASSSSQVFLAFLQERGVNPNIFFTAFAIASIISLFFIQETHNKPLKDQIQQIQALKDQAKNKKQDIQLHANDNPINSQFKQMPLTGQQYLQKYQN